MISKTWLARKYKLFFITKSRITGNKYVERDSVNDVLTAAQCSELPTDLIVTFPAVFNSCISGSVTCAIFDL